MAKLADDSEVIFRVAVAVPMYRLFDYLPPEGCDPAGIEPGIRLEVPFGKGKKVGFLVELIQESEMGIGKLKRIIRILDKQPLLFRSDLRLLHWTSRYYHYPLGEVIGTAFPVTLRKGKPAVLRAEKRYILTESGKTSDSAQLQRAPRQQRLLELFLQHQAGLNEQELSKLNENWRPAIKQLLKKEFVRIEHCYAAFQKPPTSPAINDLKCNPDQQSAIAAVRHALGRFQVFLLEGVTGSGKTEVYMQIIRSVLARGQQVLVLLPEITLTPQLENRFRQRFETAIAVFHSKLTETERQTAWLSMQQGLCSILLGTRSALFTPLQNPGLIILDEEHDTSYKQQEGFRFSARDVAVVRGKLLNVPVLLGSATPSLESLHNVKNHRYHLLPLPNRAGKALKPVLQLLDIRNQPMREGLSGQLLSEIGQTLARREQVLLFLNRRGFAPRLICHSCGWVARCHRCDANLVIHFLESKLRCHHCGWEQLLLKNCPACANAALTPLGSGTERVEKVLEELFPGKTLVRLDRDSTQRKGSLESYLHRINEGKVDIILGTQMLAKGHHFPNVTMVAILDVDSGLFSLDFHASEKLAQMIVQVSGRAGRAEKPGKVIMQTRHPDHPLLTTLLDKGYQSFAESALAERKEALLPPYSHQALLRAQAQDLQKPGIFLNQIRILAEQMNYGQTSILGPVPAPMARRAGLYRYQLLFQDTNRQALHGLLDVLLAEIDKMKLARKVRWSLDIDPVDLY
ncbi:MAG: primosomal protein N' [Gammaproteobacteria bacterium]